MTKPDVIVCSFYTDDDYYRGHANNLKSNLEALGVAYELEEIHRAEGEDWADICRKKIAFLNRVCVENPESRVYWIDVDCKLTAFPDFIHDFTADIIGFQRGFGSPLTIGYERRTRFWEPCFFGINTTPAGRKFMSDAANLELTLDIKATDDYFFEESWRANAPELSFQVIPSGCAVRGEIVPSALLTPFFVFGASGNVDEFKGKVVQHEAVGAQSRASVPLARRVRKKGLRAAKKVESTLPDGLRKSLRRVADTTGVTGALVGPEDTGSSPARQSIVNSMVRAGQRGDLKALDSAIAKVTGESVPTAKELAAVEAARSFAHYSAREGKDIPLIWWARPFPGNFGDWLSPLVLAHYTERPITFQAPTAASSKPHLISVGSIGRFIKPASIVVGTGISSTDLEIAPKAKFVSVRGPITAEVVRQSGGPEVTSFGDPGLLLSRVMPAERGETNGRIAFVRHFTHVAIPVQLPEDADEISVLMSHPDHIREFVDSLIGYDGVVTSAMHVMIICHSYGIPCALVTFEGFESTVHGTGIKYEDYSRGADLSRVYNPVPVGLTLTSHEFREMLTLEKVSEGKLDEVERAVKAAIALHAETTARV
jgi:hypothetical protein